jgi:hypothetical protein
MKTSDVPNNPYVAPECKSYKGEIIVRETGETGSTMNDRDLNKVIAWCDKCRSSKFSTRISGENIHLYDATIPQVKGRVNTINKNIRTIANNLRRGDQVTICSDHYQVHYEGMGTSNFIINNNLEQKEKKALTEGV